MNELSLRMLLTLMLIIFFQFFNTYIYADYRFRSISKHRPNRNNQFDNFDLGRNKKKLSVITPLEYTIINVYIHGLHFNKCTRLGAMDS